MVKKNPKKQDVYVKHLCPRNTHFLRNMNLILTLTFADDLALGTRRCVLMRSAFVPNMSLVTELF